MPSPPRCTFGWALAASLVFLAHATCYLYFFVDDEGITLVYARNLLHGRGLTYTLTEGPVEGYSNFLHVLVMTGLLGLVELLGLPRLWAFAAGKLWSLACGTGLIVVLWHVAGRLGLPPASRTAAALLLALAGPLAVWSNSSLETVPFSLAFMGLIATTLPAIRRPWAVTGAAAAVVLMRIDGFLFALAWLGACVLVGDAAMRRAVVRRILPALIGTATVYVAWRLWYFGAWLPLPLQTKVAHKLLETAGTVVWKDPASYLPSFARLAGLPMLLAAATGLWGLFGPHDRRRGAAALALTLALLLVYVAFVGDWMFGFRFVVPLLAPLALLAAHGLASLERHRPWLARLAAVAIVAWAAAVAGHVQGRFQAAQRKPLFWTAPSLDPARWFGEYYEAFEAVRDRAAPGTLIAYHEAGFVPFMLDVENIDMLGLTSRFFGRLPTRDAVFTDVGRYYPLTPEPPHHAAHAYLVYRSPRLVVMRRTWMGTANGGRVPTEVLDGYYRLAGETANFVIYERTERPARPGRVRAGGFLENISHPAYAGRIAVDGVPVAVETAAEQWPSLWQGQGHQVTIDPAWSLVVEPRVRAPVHEIYIEGGAPSKDLLIEVRLSAAAPFGSQRLETRVPAGRAFVWRQAIDARAAADAVFVRFLSVDGSAGSLHLKAIRIMGQTPALRDHLRRERIPG